MLMHEPRPALRLSATATAPRKLVAEILGSRCQNGLRNSRKGLWTVKSDLRITEISFLPILLLRNALWVIRYETVKIILPGQQKFSIF